MHYNTPFNVQVVITFNTYSTNKNKYLYTHCTCLQLTRSIYGRVRQDKAIFKNGCLKVQGQNTIYQITSTVLSESLL